MPFFYSLRLTFALSVLIAFSTQTLAENREPDYQRFFDLGNAYAEKNDFQSASEVFFKACERGSADGCYFFYCIGFDRAHPTDQNRRFVKNGLLLACSRKNSVACNIAAEMCFNDNEEFFAARLLEKSCALNNPVGCRLQTLLNARAGNAQKNSLKAIKKMKLHTADKLLLSRACNLGDLEVCPIR